MGNRVTVYQGQKALEIRKALHLKQYEHNKYKNPSKAEKHLKKYKALEAVK